jgi:uncharacterized OB-fold protein
MSVTSPYWEGAARGQLVIQRCRSCAHWIHFPEPICPNCGGSDFTYEPVSGRGKVETFSVIHRSFVADFADRTPYVVAWIALEEQAGLRAFGNVTGCASDEVEIGMEVEVYFEARDGIAALPNFRKKQEV